MADYLTTALGGLGTTTNETPWGTVGQILLEQSPYLINKQRPSGGNLAAAFGTALLGGLIKYRGRQDAAEQTAEAASLAQQIQSAATPEERLAIAQSAESGNVRNKLTGLVNALTKQETLQNASIQQEVARAKALAPIEVDLARAKELGVGFGELGELDKQRAAARTTLLGALSPTAPATVEGTTPPVVPSAADTLTNPEAYKVLTKPEREALAARQKLDEAKQQQADALRKEFTALPEVKNFSLIDTAAKVVSQAVKDPSSVATQELVRRAVQLIEPGMAVREGEQAAIMASQSIPDQFKGEISRALSGEGGLAAETRDGIMRIAERAYKTQAEKYKTTKDYYEGLAKERQLPPKSISYLGEPTNWDTIVGTPAGSKMDALQSILRELQTTTDPTKIADLKRQASQIYKGQ